MAMSRTEAAAIPAEAERAERCVAVGFNRRFRRSWSSARHMLVTSVPDLLDEATLTLGFDTRRWRSAASLADEATALAGLLEDVVPHQADLLAFLFDRPIDRLCADEVRFRRGHSVALTYTAQLRGGLVIRCQALHLPGHVELLEMRLNGQTLAVTPEAVIVGDLVPVLRRRCRDIWCKGVGAGRRLLGRPSATVASFIRQHCAFHLAVQGRPAGALADGTAGAAACAVGDALRASALAGGAVWVDVEEPMP